MHFEIFDDTGEAVSTSKQYERSLEDLEIRKSKEQQKPEKHHYEEEKKEEAKHSEPEINDAQRQTLLTRNATMLNNASQMIIMATNIINEANTINKELIKQNTIGFSVNKED